MIVDKLSNIDIYSQVPQAVKSFIKQLDKDIECRKYQISDTSYANVETYETKKHECCFFEAHKNYADIQILLSGTERIDYADIDKLEIKIPYDANKDIMFFQNSVSESCSVTLDGSNFVFLFPDEAHRPQMSCSDFSQIVKKVVVKIKM